MFKVSSRSKSLSKHFSMFWLITGCSVLAKVGGETTSMIQSAQWAVLSKSNSGRPAECVWIEVGRRLIDMLRSKLSVVSGTRFRKCRRNCESFRSPISSAPRVVCMLFLRRLKPLD
jgi:hypothetical protein